MAIIPQIEIFNLIKDEDLGSLKDLKMILENLPDEEIMRVLERKRGNGRDDYPVRPMWNSMIAAVYFKHASPASLIEELKRNAQLRYICGFRGYETIKNPKTGDIIETRPKWPRNYNYTRFLGNLLEEQELINQMFDTCVDKLMELLPDFGQILAIDGKAIQSYATKENKNQKEDGRRDTDANKGVKTYNGINEDGTAWEKVVSWFGYKLHLVVDANYELPVAFSVTKASQAEIPEAKKLVDEIADKHPVIMDRCDYFLGDRGYDDTKLIAKLWDTHGVKPIIDMRNMWGVKDEVRMFEGRHNIIGYDNFGTIYCYDPVEGERHLMGNGGFEKDRNTLKFLCPVKSHGIKCKGCEKCPYSNKAVRIHLKEDRRRFTPVARSSYKWDSIYKLRTSVERVNSRIDNVYGFENHYIRGLKKMRFRCSLALLMMLVLAIGRIKQNRPDLMRSLKSA